MGGRRGPPAGRWPDLEVVDAHVHVCVLDPDRYPLRPLLGDVPRAAAPVEALLGRMAACGVSAAVLVQPSYFGYDHRYLQECLAAHPRLLRGVGLCDRFAADCVGVRLNAVGFPGPGWLARTEAAGFWAAAEARGLVLCAQIAADQVAEFAAAAAAPPGLPCVIDPLGRGGWDDLRAAARLPHVHVKVSGLGALSAERHPHRELWPAALEIVAAFGPERCLFGTDASGTDPAAYAAQVELWRDRIPLGPAAREEILGGTARRLFCQEAAGGGAP
jgi:predicted TIM-barrel fold metal-dependent hydrolase